MRCGSALSTLADTSSAAAQVCEALESQLTGGIDLACVFASHHHLAAGKELQKTLIERLGPRILVGCTGESIVGRRQEIEEAPALSVWGAQLPGATLVPLRLEFARTAEGGTFVGWPDALTAEWPADASLLLLAEPFSFPADALLERLNEDHPGVKVLGGMASGAFQPGANRVLLGGDAWTDGAVGVVIAGGPRVDAVVSQGCRPIGAPAVITKAERNVILELGGRPPLVVFHELFEQLEADDQQLVQQGLHVGRVIDPYRDHFERGDFLIRNVVGADRASGALAVGDYVRAGQTIQFHVRDAHSADEDLCLLLERARAAGAEPAGGLLFTCNGRGTRLFPAEHHDAVAIADVLGDLPLAGLFAQGEMGPIGGRNFLHGFTASLALFRPREVTSTVS